MPDFFTRLAERTLGLVNAIQPVVPSLFAPGAPLIDGQAEAKQELTIEEQVAPPGSTVPPEIDAPVEPRQSPIQQVAPRSVISPPDAQPAPTVERARPSQPQDEPAARSEPSKAALPTESSPVIEQLSAAPPTNPMRQPSERSERAKPAARRAEAAQIVNTSEAAPSSESIAQRPTIDPQPASTAPRARSQVTAQPFDRGSSARSTVPVPVADERQTPTIERRTSPTRAERPALVGREPTIPLLPPTPRVPEPPTAQPAPQIHVSIGRIEVRAVTPPPAAAPQPKPAPTPRMSLDEYLRSQNGDRR